MRLVLSKDSKRDLAQIFDDWAERVSLEVAERLVDSIFDRFALVTRFPDVGRNSDDLSPGLLRVTAGEYVVYYRKSPRNIRIVRVVHGARDQKSAY